MLFLYDDQNLKKREEKRIKIGIDESKMTSAVLTNSVIILGVTPSNCLLPNTGELGGSGIPHNPI